jgi:hypothetical protein
VDEIQNLVDHFHIGEVGFLDDDFIGTKTEGRRRAAAIADLLLERRLDIIYNIECRPDMVERELFARLKESGLRSVFIGIEGVTPAAIQAFHKGINRDLADRALQILRDLDLDADVGFILYYPDATLEEVWEGYEFLKRHGQCDVHTALNRLFVVPGAPILEQLRQEGRLREVGADAALGVYEYDYADRRVGVLLAILRVAVLPLFTTWYNALKAFRRLRADRKFRADAEAAGAPPAPSSWPRRADSGPATALPGRDERAECPKHLPLEARPPGGSVPAHCAGGGDLREPGHGGLRLPRGLHRFRVRQPAPATWPV